jgi:Protein of unknown function (DUF4038)/Putative collagen-binding domain of a collagenase
MRRRFIVHIPTSIVSLGALLIGVSFIGAVQRTNASAATGLAFPAGVSANHRYLVDQNALPYMVNGDSPHSLFVNLTETQADTYFADRQAHGFNAAWIQILCDGYTGGRPDGSTYDGIMPFTTPDDFSTPNPAYFARIDDMVTLAGNHGITVFLDPVDMAGWLTAVESNGPTKDFNYGAYLGNRYKDFPNVIWLNGNDFQTWSNATDDADARAVANGILSSDTNHIQTVELDYVVSSSLDDQSWVPIIGMNAAYTYNPTYAEVLHAYNQTPTMPVTMVEANYEFENYGGPDTTAEALRRQEYWTMTSGATGQLYGSHYTWNDGTNWSDEQAHLDTTGVAQYQIMENIFGALPWYSLTPTASLVTSGAGTFDSGNMDVLQSNYATAAMTPDGTYGVVYVPTARTIGVNLGLMQGTVSASWFDPATGTSTPASAPFTTPGTHADGASDWLLLLKASGTTTMTTTLPASTTTTTLPASTTTTTVPANTTTTTTTTTTTIPASTTTVPASTTTTTTVQAVKPTFKQVASATPQTAQSKVSVKLSKTEAAGDMNVVVVSMNDMTASISSVTDSLGSVYSIAAPLARGNGVSQAIYYAPRIRAGPDTVTVTLNKAANYVDVRFAEYAGVSTLDQAGVATGNGGVAAATVTASRSNELIVGAASVTWSIDGAGPGFTARVITSPDADILEDSVSTAAGSYTAASTGMPNGWVAQAVSFT